MPAKLDENTQFTSLGQPLTNGKLFIGPKNGDPKITQIPIFSDEDLTMALANPQTLDADGRPANKIYVTDEYSLLVEDLNEVQKLSDPTAGSTSEVSVNSLTNVQGANTITAEGNPPISGYVDKQQYIFRAVGTNTQAPPSISIDGLPAVSIKRNLDQNVLAGQFQQDQLIIVAFNALTTFMEWQNQNLKVAHWSRGADIASATTLTLGIDGNYFEITGTMTITGIATFGIGTIVKLHFQDSLILTHNATTFSLPGGLDIRTQPGDELEFIEYATGNWRMTNFPPIAATVRDLSTVTVTNTTTETSIFSFSVPGGLLGTNRMLRVNILGTYRNSSAGAANLTIRLKYGATTVATNFQTSQNSPTVTTGYEFNLYLVGDDSTTAQKGSFGWHMGDSIVNGSYACTGYGVAAEDSTGALTLDVTWQHSVANANLTFVKEAAFARLE